VFAQKAQRLKNNVQYLSVEQRLIYQIHARGCMSERDSYGIQLTRITPWLITAFRYRIYQHNTLLRHNVIRALPNAKVLWSAMIIITLKTLCNGHNQTWKQFWMESRL